MKCKLVLAIAAALSAITLVACPLDEVKNIRLDGIDLSNARDGVYPGNYDTTLIKAAVSVRIESGRVTEVEITKHECGKGQAAVSVTDEVVKEQTTLVDTVSGATGSRLVILKAIENAVAKAAGGA